MRIDRVTFAAEMTRREMRDIRLAELSGVSRSTISAIRGGKSVSKDTVKKIAVVLQIPDERLVEGEKA